MRLPSLPSSQEKINENFLANENSSCVLFPWQIACFPRVQRKTTVEAFNRIRKAALLRLVKSSSGEILGRRASSTPARETGKALIVRWHWAVSWTCQERNEEGTCREGVDVGLERVVGWCPGFELSVTINALNYFMEQNQFILYLSHFRCFIFVALFCYVLFSQTIKKF